MIDVRQGIDVDPPGGQIGRHQDGDAARLEVVERAGPLGLALVAVDRRGQDPVTLELLGEPVGAVLGAGKDKRLVDPAGLDEVGQELALALAVDRQDELPDELGRGVPASDLDHRRIAQDVGGQAPDVVREGGREEERLAIARKQADDPPDVADEAHVEEAVRLVKDQDLDVAEIDRALPDVVEQPPRGRDDDLRPGAQGPDLGVEADTAVDGRRADRAARAVRPDALLDLQGQLASRCKDQRPDPDRAWRCAGRGSWGCRSAGRCRGPGPSSRISRLAWSSWRIGRTNAAVLPVPVWAPARTSRPARTRGIASAWTGVGSV